MSDPRQFKDAIYDPFARMGKAVASPRRLELLDLLCHGRRTVELLASQTNQSLANVPAHLQVLRDARLVDAEKEEQVCEFFQALRRLAESRLVEVEHITRTFLEQRGALVPVDREARIKKVRREEITLLDVRPVEECAAGHIPGALSIPLADLKKRLSAIPRSREVVAYCRGPCCVLAIEAVTLLRARGYRAARVEEGIPEWRARGLPVEVSPQAAP